MATLTPDQQAVYDAVIADLRGGFIDISALPDGSLDTGAYTLPVVIDRVLKKVQAVRFANRAASMVAGSCYLIAGKASPVTNPGTPEFRTFYLAAAAGTYTRFLDSNGDAITVATGEVAMLMYNPVTGCWTKQVIENLFAGQEAAETAIDSINTTKDAVVTWFGADDAHGIRKTWLDWFSDTLATGVRKIWDLWFTNARLDWNNWFGATVAAGIRKTWSDWFEETQFARTVLLRELAAYNDRLKNLEVPFYDEGSGKVVFPVTDGVTYNENTGYLTLSNDYCDLLGVYYNEDTGFIDIGVANETVSGNEE